MHRAVQINHLLKALRTTELESIQPALEYVPLRLGEILYQPGISLKYVYFPTTAVISLQSILEDGCCAEISAVGKDGVLGLTALLGGDINLSRAVVLCAGDGYRMKVGVFKQEFNRGGAFMHILLRYTSALITQISQIAVCNRHHSIDQQLCRWLLLNLDRVDTQHLYVTHELIGNILGVRREGISVAAGKLQREGVIHYRRGHIEVLDRSKLEMKACECYKIVRQHADYLASGIVN